MTTVTARVIGLVLLSATIGGCRREPAATSLPPIIVVVPKGSTQDYWRTIRAGASEEAERLDVDVSWPSAFRENDPQAQWMVVEQAKALAAQQKRQLGIVIAPLDRRAFVEPIANLQKSGIPVMLFDSEIEGEDYLSFVGTHNENAGRAAGEHLAALLGRRGNVALLRLSPPSDSIRLREKGFLDAIAQYPEMKIVNERHNASGLVESAYRHGHQLIDETGARNGGLDGIFTPNESTTMGMQRALKDESLGGRVKHVGFDRTAMLVSALWNGELAALVLQDPFEMGKISIRRVTEHLRNGGSFEKKTYVPFRIAVREDLERRQALRARHEDEDGNVTDEQNQVLRLLFPKRVILH